MRGTRNSSEESEMGDESTSVELSQVWVESKAKHAWKRSSRRSILFGLRIELRLAADKQQLQMKQMSRALAQLPQIRIRIANCSAWEGGGGWQGEAQRQALLKICRIHLCKWSGFYDAAFSACTQEAMPSADKRERERKIGGRESGAERKEKKPSNEWNLSRLFSSFCATIKQFTYIFEYSNILLTNYAEGITERKSGKKRAGEGQLPMGSGCCPSSFALMNLKPFCLRLMWEMNT